MELEIAKQIEAAQQRANQMAIQESNLRDQLAPLQAQLEQIVRAKHQALGGIEALIRLANEERAQSSETLSPKHEPGGK